MLKNQRICGFGERFLEGVESCPGIRGGDIVENGVRFPNVEKSPSKGTWWGQAGRKKFKKIEPCF
jgi:hypothetical protein